MVITEIGGTVGDIESQPFLEAIRQVAGDVGRNNVMYIHVTLVPYLKTSGELKSKPTQHSVKELLSIGIQPDMLICRSEVPLEESQKDKIALFCNVSKDCVFENLNCDTIYDVPIMLENQNLSEKVCERLGIEALSLIHISVLLIAAILDDTTLKEFMSIAESLGLDCLTEVHDIEEMKRVNNLGAKIVGINNRNLKTFEEDLHTTERLTAGLENRSEKAVVSESGIKNNTDLRYLETLGIDAVLIGESFMRRQDIAGAVSSMRGL